MLLFLAKPVHSLLVSKVQQAKVLTYMHTLALSTHQS